MTENNNPIRLQSRLALCVCTYKRPQLLELLLLDVKTQTLQPEAIVIVDGDSSSGQILEMLHNLRFPSSISVFYVASNHGNQTYQRYLGWQTSKSLGVKKILYLDDDLRIEQPTAIQNIVAPLDWVERKVVAVTGTLDMGMPKSDDDSLTLVELREGLPDSSNVISRFGTSRKYQPGDVTSAGNRIPVIYSGNPYEPVKWLRGGAFAIRVDSLSKEILSDDIFAMNHMRYGLCEDLIISRRLISSGEIMLAFNAVFRHPSEDPPKAYSSNAYQLAFAIAYSRKWFNDNYRGFNPPRLADRLALLKNYMAVLLLNTWRVLISFNKQRALFTYGFLRGIVYSLIKKPTSDSLTPGINWWADAEEALSNQIRIK